MKKHIKLQAMSFVSVIILLCGNVGAQQSSANYQMPRSVLDGGGGLAVSPSFVLEDSAGQPSTVGFALSTSMDINAGYQQDDDVPTGAFPILTLFQPLPPKAIFKIGKGPDVSLQSEVLNQSPTDTFSDNLTWRIDVYNPSGTIQASATGDFTATPILPMALLRWNTTFAQDASWQYGIYVARITLGNTYTGFIYDTAQAEFSITDAEITKLETTNQKGKKQSDFIQGETVFMEARAHNLSSTPVSGQMLFEVKNPSGASVYSYLSNEFQLVNNHDEYTNYTLPADAEQGVYTLTVYLIKDQTIIEDYESTTFQVL